MILRNLLPQRTQPAVAAPERLEDLIATAESYGKVKMWGSEPAPNGARHYSVDIEFSTVKGIKLQASSEYGLPLNAALRQAIDRAEVIRGQFK
jgi:hypothetical protein